MQCQLQQMKSSIANIQHHLRKLQCEQTIKINEESILPESLVHEHVYEKPRPSPKITSSIPNVTRTDIYTPARHHLDDTEMRKVIRYDQGRDGSRSGSRRGSGRKKEKSLTVKTKYIYDGARVVYVPPLLETQSDFGHLVVQAGKNKARVQQQITRNYAAQQEYGTTRRQSKKERTKAQKQKLKTKMSRATMNPGQKYQRDEAYSQQWENQQQVNRVVVVERGERARVRSKAKMKSIKIQCKIGQDKIKEPFIVSWNPETDSEFSEMDI